MIDDRWSVSLRVIVPWRHTMSHLLSGATPYIEYYSHDSWFPTRRNWINPRPFPNHLSNAIPSVRQPVWFYNFFPLLQQQTIESLHSNSSLATPAFFWLFGLKKANTTRWYYSALPLDQNRPQSMSIRKYLRLRHPTCGSIRCTNRSMWWSLLAHILAPTCHMLRLRSAKIAL